MVASSRVCVYVCVCVIKVRTPADKTEGGAGQDSTEREGGSKGGDYQSHEPGKTTNTSRSREDQTAGTHTLTHSHTHTRLSFFH